MKLNGVTWERFHERLIYNPKTGEFIWKAKSQGHAPGAPAGGINCRGYHYIYIDGHSLLAHRIAWFMMYKTVPKMLDHINQNRSDNRIENLRECDQFTNQANSKLRADNTSGSKGVSFNPKTGMYSASIRRLKKPVSLGVFYTKEAAIRAYKNAAEDYFGAFASTTQVEQESVDLFAE